MCPHRRLRLGWYFTSTVEASCLVARPSATSLTARATTRVTSPPNPLCRLSCPPPPNHHHRHRLLARQSGTQASASTTTARTSPSLAPSSAPPSGFVQISSSSIVTGVRFSLLFKSAATLIDPTSQHDPYSAAKATADALPTNPPQCRRAGACEPLY